MLLSFSVIMALIFMGTYLMTKNPWPFVFSILAGVLATPVPSLAGIFLMLSLALGFRDAFRDHSVKGKPAMRRGRSPYPPYGRR